VDIIQLLQDKDWDAAVFKKLPRNDTGDGPGHQAGMVIPKDLRLFFPRLLGEATPQHPAVDRYIRAILIVDRVEVARVQTRYQMQTWGGMRRPETRLTDQLPPLRNRAHAGDYLVIQRFVNELDFFRLILVRQGTPDYDILRATVGAARWGIVGESRPVTEQELERSEEEESDREQLPFRLFDPEAATTETRTIRVARSIAFRQSIMREYRNNCSVCMSVLRSPTGLFELDAAHIVPRGRMGADDARNGLALCKRHHWAFDIGLFGIDEDRRIFVPNVVRQMPENEVLTVLLGRKIVEAETVHLRASSEALAWHIENIVM